MKVSHLFGFSGLIGLAIAPSLSFAQNMGAVPALPNISPENIGKCMRLVPKAEVTRQIPLNPIMTYEGHNEYTNVTPKLVPGTYQYAEVEGYSYSIPQFKNIQDEIVVSPGYNKLVAIEGKMGTEYQTVVIRPPSLVWKKGANLSSLSAKDPKSGDIYCLVEDRGIVENVPVTRVVRPYDFKIEWVEPKTKTVSRMVIDTQAPMITKTVAPKMAQLAVQLLANPDPAANTKEALVAQSAKWIDGQQKSLSFQQIDAPAGYAWEYIDCESVKSGPVNMGGATKITAPQATEVKFPQTTNVIVTKKQLQTRLRDLGLYNGPIDGIIGVKTKSAIASFQSKNNLAVTGNADTATLKALGF